MKMPARIFPGRPLRHFDEWSVRGAFARGIDQPLDLFLGETGEHPRILRDGQQHAVIFLEVFGRAPATWASLGRNRAITWSADSVRSPSGFRLANMKPELVEKPPVKPATLAMSAVFNGLWETMA